MLRISLSRHGSTSLYTHPLKRAETGAKSRVFPPTQWGCIPAPGLSRGESSHGQQQRVGIGRALPQEARCFSTREPRPLDPDWVDDVLVLVRTPAERKQTMLIVTEEMQFARQIADREVFIHSAKIFESGAPDQILGTPQDERQQRFPKRMGA